jgi:hypothetical protein
MDLYLNCEVCMKLWAEQARAANALQDAEKLKQAVTAKIEAHIAEAHGTSARRASAQKKPS